MKHKNKTLRCFQQKSAESYIRALTFPSKENIYRALCLNRGYAVRMIAEYLKVREHRMAFQKMSRKFKKPLSDGRIVVSVVNPYLDFENWYKSKLAELGSFFFYLLDEWQKYGATNEELRIFCNGCGSSWFERIEDMAEFSVMTGAGYADYKELGDWIETIPEAPLTICMKEYMLYQMMHTEHGKQAAEYALHKVFPELEEKLLYRCTDAEGNEFFVNEDGDIITELSEE